MINIFRSWSHRYFANEEAVILLLLLAGCLLMVLYMGNVLAPMIASIIIAFLMQGVVARLCRLGLSHLVAVSIAFLLLLGAMLAFFLLVLPIVWQQTVKLVAEAPGMLSEWQEVLLLLPERYPALLTEQHVEQIIEIATTELALIGQGVLSFSVAQLPMLIGLLIYVVLVPILVFFFLKDSRSILQWISGFLPKERPVMDRVWYEMNDQIANYVRGKVIEIILVATTTYITFVFLGLKYAALLSIAVGLSVLVPYIGAAVVTVPVAMIGFFQWGWGSEFMYLMLAYGVIQALDGNVLVPLLFSEAVNLHPVAIILAVLVFGGLWGLWGVFFAIPLATLIKAVINAWPSSEQALATE